MRRMIGTLALLGVCGLPACGPAVGSINPKRLAETAYQALGEARTQARGWATDARLSYVEGTGVQADGTVDPEGGFWRFVYDAPSQSRQLAVTVSSLEVTQEQRTPQGPPGYVLGDRSLDTGWIDSDAAIRALPAGATAPEEGFSMLLVPLTPEQWVIRGAEKRWQVDAKAGTVIQ